MDNIQKIIKKHNDRIIMKDRPKTNAKINECNCKISTSCPLQNKCLTNNIVYMATISTVENPTLEKQYIGSATTEFKVRWANHKTSFNNVRYKNVTSLSKYYWELIGKGLTPTIKWKILRRAQTCRSLDSPCRLCLQEKIAIISFTNRTDLLNKREEVAIRCRHKEKFLLSSN